MAIPSKEKYTNRLLGGDVEANALLEKVTKIWCLVSIDIDTNELFLFHNYPEYNNFTLIDPHDDLEYTLPERTGTLDEGVKFWVLAANNSSKLIIHNCSSYDRPLLEKFYPSFKTPLSAWWDTYIQSKMQWFDRPAVKGAKGIHGLGPYGVRFGINKPEVSDWTFFDEFKLHRCIEDVKIQNRTYKYLQHERETVKEKLGVDLLGGDSWITENIYAKNVSLQELRGSLVDLPHIEECLVDLDTRLSSLRASIEPKLPPTLKKKTPGISRKDMAEIFYGKEKAKKVPDEYEMVMENGEEVRKVKKQYRKPTTNFHKTIKTNLYTGFEVSCGASEGTFHKKAELREWIKTNFPDNPPKTWDIEKEEVDKVLNKNTCEYFGVKETDTAYIVGAHTRIEFIPSSLTQSDIVKQYLIKVGWKSPFEWNLKKVDGQKVRAEFDTLVVWPKSATPKNQIKKLVKKGEPLVTSPKLTAHDYEFLPEGLGRDVSDFSSYSHRRRFLENPDDPENKGLKSFIRGDGRVGCGVNNFNCATSRSVQSRWVNAPGEGALYGEEIRKCIKAGEGRKIIGIDMASCQLAVASYYAKNTEYYNAVASGNSHEDLPDGSKKYVGMSAHCFSARLFDMVSIKEWEEAVRAQDEALIKDIMLRRKKSKAASFGTLFGCSGKLLARMLGIPDKEGNSKKEAFLRQMGLNPVIDWLKDCKDRYGRSGGWYIPLPMGYWVWCNMAHASINYLIQGTEAVAQKLAVNYFEEKAKELGIDAIKILDVHDEMLLDCAEKDVKAAGELACEAYTYASNMIYDWHMNNPDMFPNNGTPAFRFDLNGGYEVGNNYAEVH